jgi:hypothetical protein
MLPATLSDYGAPYQDVRPTRDPTTQLAAAKYNRMVEDAAQGTRTAPRAEVSFLTTATAAPTTVAAGNVTCFTVWGSGSAQKPVVTKTATGSYTLTWTATFDDGLVGVENMETVAVTESVVFTMPIGAPNTRSAAGYAKVLTIASNVVTVGVYDNNTDALSDLSGGVAIDLALR